MALLRTTLLLLPMQIVFRAGEALLPVLLAMWFGRSDATDVYYFAWAVFTFAGSLVFQAYTDSALIPILAEVKIQDRASLPRVVGSLLAHTLLLGGALAAVIGLVAWGWFSVRYQGAELALASRMVPAFCAYLVALSVRTFFGAVLNADHRFFAAPVASAIGMVVTLGLIATARGALGVLSVPIGSLAGEVTAVAALIGLARLAEIRFELTLARPDAVLRFARLIASEVGGAAVTRVNPVVDQLMAGLSAVVGGGTLLRLSGDVASVPTSLLQASLLPVLISHLADDFAARRLGEIRATVTRALLVVIAALAAAAALLWLVREPLLRAVFLRGAMDEAGVERMARLLGYHLVGLPGFGALLVLARAHVAMKNSGIMLGMGILNASLNAFFNVVLLKVIGLEGIALSTSCVQMAIALVFWVRFRRKLAREGA